jgi:hypothetical protein
MNKIIALMLIAAFAVVAGCAKTPTAEVVVEDDMMIEEVVVEEVVMPTAEEVVVEEETMDIDAATEVEVY